MSMKEKENRFEDGEEIVELEDENGNAVTAVHVATLSYKGEWYACFAVEPEEVDEEADEDESEIAIFRIEGDGENETLEVVEDDALLDEVFAEYCHQYNDFEDAEEAMALEPDEEN